MTSAVIKKLLYQSSHRGTKELDLIVGTFAKDTLHTLSDDEIHTFTLFLSESEPDIYDWIMGYTDVPVVYDDIVKKIAIHHSP